MERVRMDMTSKLWVSDWSTSTLKHINQPELGHGMSFSEMGKVKRQEWQRLPRTKGVVENQEISIRKNLVG